MFYWQWNYFFHENTGVEIIQLELFYSYENIQENRGLKISKMAFSTSNLNESITYVFNKVEHESNVIFFDSNVKWYS